MNWIVLIFGLFCIWYGMLLGYALRLWVENKHKPISIDTVIKKEMLEQGKYTATYGGQGWTCPICNQWNAHEFFFCRKCGGLKYAVKDSK